MIVQFNFDTFKEYDVNNRFFNPNLAGGALLDIDIYMPLVLRVSL